MIAKRGLAVAVVLLPLMACGDPTASGPGRAFVVSSGTFFSMCGGYCRTELTVDSTTVRFVERSWDGKQSRERSITIALQDWQHIRSLADVSALRSVEGVHGCPDCADGGGEWVQILTRRDSVRATFEYGATLAPIDGLQSELRALRQQFH